MSNRKESWLDYLLKDEDKAVKEYTELAEALQLIGYPRLSKLALGIADDEARHFKILKQIGRSIK